MSDTNLCTISIRIFQSFIGGDLVVSQVWKIANFAVNGQNTSFRQNIIGYILPRSLVFVLLWQVIRKL